MGRRGVRNVGAYLQSYKSYNSRDVDGPCNEILSRIVIQVEVYVSAKVEAGVGQRQMRLRKADERCPHFHLPLPRRSLPVSPLRVWDGMDRAPYGHRHDR